MKRALHLIILMLLLLAPISYAKDFYSLGVNAYNSRNYFDAVKNFQYAIKINPKDVNSRYYLAQAYINLKLNSDAKEQYTKIILLAPVTYTASLAQKGLSLIRQAEIGNTIAQNGNSQISDTSASNYLLYVLANGNVRKWETMPISVYVQPSPYKNTVVNAFKQWQNSTQGLVKFIFTANKNSQITVEFTNKLEAVAGKESYVAGFSKPYYKNGYFTKSEIRILTIDPEDNKPLPNNFIYFSTLHEIGHSLGFNGHSPNDEDVMFASSTSPKDKLTQRDITTMKLLYTIDKTKLAAIKSANKKDVKLEQLQNYVKEFPDKTVGWTNLADHYAGKGNYQEAIKNYNKAISISPTRAEPYNLLGSTYAKMGDTKNAYNNFKRACELDKHNDFYIYQFMQICTTPEQKAVGQKLLNDFIKNNPDKANTERIRNLLNN